jgi:NAD-dependent deacetylase
MRYQHSNCYNDLMLDSIKRARDLLHKSQRPIALAGAGLSAESGVPTFRGAGGLWRSLSFQDLATPEGFARNPQLVWEWYAERRDNGAACKPNPGHYALAEIERKRPDFWLLTQNVDGLSARAGSTRVIEFHGSIWRIKCTGCGFVAEDRSVPTNLDNHCKQCTGGRIRPDVVWFGEALDNQNLAHADKLANACDLLLVVGTSAQVYPAAGYVPMAARAGADIIEINPEATQMSSLATVTLRSPVGEVLPKLVEGLR